MKEDRGICVVSVNSHVLKCGVTTTIAFQTIIPFVQSHPSGHFERGVASYRQLLSLRLLAGGCDCLDLRADYAVCGGSVATARQKRLAKFLPFLTSLLL